MTDRMDTTKNIPVVKNAHKSQKASYDTDDNRHTLNTVPKTANQTTVPGLFVLVNSVFIKRPSQRCA